MKSSVLNTVLCFVLLTSSSFAQTAPKADREGQFLSAIVRTVDPKSASEVKGMITEAPVGLNPKDISPWCDPRSFEDQVLAKKLSTTEYFKQLKDYFKRCEGELSSKGWHGIFALLKYSMYYYPIFTHPNIKLVTVPLPSGVKVPAILAMKEDTRPRPLIVVKCGVFCSAEESPSTRAYIMKLFDQSPFNVLFLANQTGLDYMEKNRYVSLGGWSEGYEAVQVGKWMKDTWELRNRISSVHLMGISLGGNAAVFGAAFNDMRSEEHTSELQSH